MAVTPYEEKKYVQSDAVTQAQQALQNQQAAKPGAYQSQFQTGINDLMSQIQERPKFNYDVNSDALYQQVAQNYLQQGKQAMMDTMGQASMLTGGYGNSYAQTVGQQTYDGYLQGIADLVPQFQQMALQQYQMEGDDLFNRYNLMQQQEEAAYNRYMDVVNQYYADLDRMQAAYDSERDYDYSRFADDRDFDYGKYMDDLNYQYQLDRDKTEDNRWIQQWQYQQERDRIADEQWQKEFDEAQRQYNETLAWQQAQAAARSSGGGSGGGRYYGNPQDDENDDLDDAYTVYQQNVSKGYGSAATLDAMKKAGYSNSEINSALKTYQQEVVKPLSKPVKTKHGTM